MALGGAHGAEGAQMVFYNHYIVNSVRSWRASWDLLQDSDIGMPSRRSLHRVALLRGRHTDQLMGPSRAASCRLVTRRWELGRRQCFGLASLSLLGQHEWPKALTMA